MGAFEPAHQGIFNDLTDMFISIANLLHQLRMLYATTMENLKKAVNIGLFIHADGPEDIEWEEVLKTASGGKAK